MADIGEGMQENGMAEEGAVGQEARAAQAQAAEDAQAAEAGSTREARAAEAGSAREAGSAQAELTVAEARELIEGAALPRTSNEEAMETAAAEALAALDAEGAGSGGVPSEGGSDEAAARSFSDSTVGLGVDIVEIARMAYILERTPAFAKRVFSEAEQAYCNKMANPATHYALRFAAKEAVSKALGTGIAEGVGVRDIEVERAASGKPSVKLSGGALAMARKLGVRDLSISLSYTHTDAVACVMAVTDAAVKASEKRKDPMEELARKFKETRGILDEI